MDKDELSLRISPPPLFAFVSFFFHLLPHRIAFFYRRSREWRRCTRRHACFSASRACETANSSAWQYSPVSKWCTAALGLFLFYLDPRVASRRSRCALVSVVPSFKRTKCGRTGPMSIVNDLQGSVSASNYGAPLFNLLQSRSDYRSSRERSRDTIRAPSSYVKLPPWFRDGVRR